MDYFRFVTGYQLTVLITNVNDRQLSSVNYKLHMIPTDGSRLVGDKSAVLSDKIRPRGGLVLPETVVMAGSGLRLCRVAGGGRLVSFCTYQDATLTTNTGWSVVEPLWYTAGVHMWACAEALKQQGRFCIKHFNIKGLCIKHWDNKDTLHIKH